jgi:N-glycosylase/DNA lyase
VKNILDGISEMKILAVDKTIRRLCVEVQSERRDLQCWSSRTEEDLLYEACVCMFSSQMVFELAEATAQRLRDFELLRTNNLIDYEQRISIALSDPLTIYQRGQTRKVRPRFKNRLASLLATTVLSMRAQSVSIHGTLTSARTAREARELLINLIWGFGPKQASLFLRRVGYCSELAVLDTHILDYLRVARGIDPKPNVLSRISGYEKIEAEFQSVAAEFGHPVGCVDLAMWVTMRVAKREAFW